MTAAERTARTEAADATCRAAYDGCGGPASGVALVALGGYGRGELAPHSDLDLLLVHDDGVDPGMSAAEVWYPLWDGGHRLDHAVRSVGETVTAASADLRVVLGLLDVRHVAGDPGLTLRLRTTLLAQWRREARERIPQLRPLVRRRHELAGELAHASVPDLKESEGGLRDATVLQALVATWLVDVPHADLERSRQALLDVRDVVQQQAGRAVDRVGPEAWRDLADGLGLRDARAAQVHVREHGRRVTHLSRLTWRRASELVERRSSLRGARRPALVPVAPGVALSRGEVVLDARARPASDPLLLLRAAAEAAERDVVLSPTTTARLVREAPPLPEPWSEEARRLLVRLLAAGRGLLEVWETLEETGALARLLPEWEGIRLLPHASPIHRFTVDRHVVETCVEVASLIRTVARPDVLLVAALLHDVGKAEVGDHSVVGEPVARRVATRLGFDPAAVDQVALLVRHHLLLAETATTRDLDDPATTALVADRVGDPETLALLLALTEADARAASAPAWSSWRAGLVRRLAARTRAHLEARAAGVATPVAVADDVAVPDEVVRDPREVWVGVEPHEDRARVTVVSGDRIGLLADAAAALALQRCSVLAARAWSHDGVATSVWEVRDDGLVPAVLRERVLAVAEGRVDPAARLRRPSGDPALAPSVQVRPEASQTSTVLEVRAADRPGVVWSVCRTLADLGVGVRSAHVVTLGPQAVDVFYLAGPAGGPLAPEDADAIAEAVRAALSEEPSGTR
ncbi:[protein-PII] uridylyltransferase [Nocardioides perillae]|uniref:Bifunctional uridylyltransferase/uridylyl-removing enzyme n=1 Tax=Nocardioides perillae TaxID=1119534 RepID=A0A7Y9RW14_9ACTN|nr:[protein-PII] uridylyltransferase [Nocardioides perillae]